MPTINVKKDLLMQKLGKNYTDEEFDELCFQFGIELDEITSEKKMAMKEKSATGQESDDVIYKIDIPANRYDLVCLEGLVLALNIFTCKMKPPKYKVKPSKLEFFVDQHAHSVRPILIGAVVRNVNLNEDLYNSFIDLQDKIHQNIGRKRSLVSIGTHDLDNIEGPFLYTAMKPNDLKFVPLNQDKTYSATELMNLYADSHLKSYLPLIKGKPEYPVILDKNRNVLSMPPIINGNKSRISLKTKNILIEVTATDSEKATIALDTVVSMLVSSNNSFEAESVQIKHADGRSYVTPDMSYQKEQIKRDYINRGLGLNLDAGTIASLLTRMGHRAQPSSNGENIEVQVPPTRHDIIHKCDIMEDVGIAYGYDNIKKTLPRSATIAYQVPLNKLSDQLRNEVARCGYTEALNFALCSEAETGTMLGRKLDAEDTVRIQNPKTIEFQVARTCLLPGLLKTINSNKKMPLPMKLFEVADVVLADPKTDVGARNERHLAAIYFGKQTSGFETIHGLLDRVMQVLDSPYIGDKPDREKLKKGYYIEATSDGAYLNGRCAAVIFNGEKIGLLGILHPNVLSNFELNHPSSALEIDIEMCQGR